MIAESNLSTESASTIRPVAEPLLKSPKLWMPKRVVFTADALNEPFGQAMYERLSALNLPIEIAKNNRITGLRGADERETYRIAKNTLAVVNAPPECLSAATHSALGRLADEPCRRVPGPLSLLLLGR